LAQALVRLAAHCELSRLVDIGGGNGELVRELARHAPHLDLTVVEVRPRPADLPRRIAWLQSPGGAELPALGESLSEAIVLAHEWLDDIPTPVVERASEQDPWELLAVTASGEELGAGDPSERDLIWLGRWWPTGLRAEVGHQRDLAWQSLLRQCIGQRSLLVAVDYGHEAEDRPEHGSLTGFRLGRQTRAIPDGRHNLTAHVALDAVAAAGRIAGAQGSWIVPQHAALAALGVSSLLPERESARTDPSRYLADLAAASSATALLDPTGLGGFSWLLQTPQGGLARDLGARLAQLPGLPAGLLG
ncbi:MAG: SAM-dependent methyltransferase, partial [Angustibacter sp.]